MHTDTPASTIYIYVCVVCSLVCIVCTCIIVTSFTLFSASLCRQDLEVMSQEVVRLSRLSAGGMLGAEGSGGKQDAPVSPANPRGGSAGPRTPRAVGRGEQKEAAVDIQLAEGEAASDSSATAVDTSAAHIGQEAAADTEGTAADNADDAGPESGGDTAVARSESGRNEPPTDLLIQNNDR